MSSLIILFAGLASAYVAAPLHALQRVHSAPRVCLAATAADADSAKVAELRAQLSTARAEVRLARAAGGIKLINAQEAVDALLDRIDLQLHLESESPAVDYDDDTIVAKVEKAIGNKGLPLRGRRAPPPVACAAGGNPASTSRDVDVSPAAADVAACLASPAVNVPHVDHVHDWLPDVEVESTPYHGGCMTDVQTRQEDECVVPLADTGTFVDESHVVLADPVVGADANAIDLVGATAYKAGGPREHVVFRAEEVTAAVVTCGGLCPGLNTVVRELVNCLRRQYGVSSVSAGRRGRHALPPSLSRSTCSHLACMVPHPC